MNQVKIILSQLKELFLKMTGAQKLSIAFFIAGVVAVLFAFISRATAPQGDQVLFYSVAPSTAAEITDKLNDLRLEYKYSNGAILVSPDADVDVIRMSLAQEGLLPEDLSYDFSRLIKESGFSLTKDERDQRFDIALQNELAKAIMKMGSIIDATILISKEEPSPLLKRHQQRTASVHLTVRGKRSLNPDEAKGIAHYVASAVKGLSYDQVSIIDSRGKHYNASDDTDASDKWELARREERLIAEKIEDYLMEFVPKAKAKVAISLDLQRRRKEIKDFQHRDLNKGALGVLTRNIQEKQNSKSKEGSQGVVGAGTNSQADIKEGDGGTQNDTSKSSKDENFENSFVQEFITYDGALKQVNSVSVVVVNKKINDQFNPNEPVSKENPEYVDYDWFKEKENGRPSLEEQIANVIGLSDLSKVKVTQQSMMLNMSPAPPTMLAKISDYFDWTLVTMIALALIGSAFIARMIKKAQPEEEIVPMPEYEEEEKKDNLPPLKEPEYDPRLKQIEGRIKEIIEEDPVKAASLIRHWLSSD